MKKVTALILCCLLFLTMIPLSAASEHWAQESIAKLQQANILPSDEAQIRPDDKITRGEFVNLTNLCNRFENAGKDNFPDVADDAWYAKDFAIAKSLGYLQGDENGNANPESFITRAELSVILSRLYGITSSSASVQFEDDSDIPSWAKNAIYGMQEKGIVNGYLEDGKSYFKPQNNTTRAETFTLLVNLMDSSLKPVLGGKTETIASTQGWDATIKRASEIGNQAKTVYTDQSRETLLMENMDMSMQHTLKGNALVSKFASKDGKAYVEDTMDAVLVDKDGIDYRASRSATNARLNIYRLGHLYTDVRILELDLKKEGEAETSPIKGTIDTTDASKMTSHMTSPLEVKDGEVQFTITDPLDPYLVLKEINVPTNGSTAISFDMQYSGDTGTGKIYYATSEHNSISEKQASSFNIITDGEYRHYVVNVKSDAWADNIQTLRFDINGGVINSNVKIKNITIMDSAQGTVPVKMEKAYHLYGDKIYQEFNYYTTGNLDANELYAETKIDKASVNSIQGKDKNGTFHSVDGFDTESVEYMAFDTDAGIFGYVFSDVPDNGKVTLTQQDGSYTLRQYAKQSGAIKSDTVIRVAARLVNSSSHDFTAIEKASYEEHNPIPKENFKLLDGNDYNAVKGYDPYTGTYVITTGASSFNEAFNNPQVQFAATVNVQNTDMDRQIYLTMATKAGALEASVVLDEGQNMVPMMINVTKNFSGENEEPFYDKGDPSFGESTFPLVLEKGKSLTLTSIHLYQNFGKYPLKQVSGIRFFAPYYHISTGVTETNTWVPFYLSNDGWVMPDFRARSGIMWKDQPQFDSIGMNKYCEYPDGKNGFIRGENTSATINSAGPTYSDLTLGYTTYDNKIDYDFRTVEFPQTDENRTFLKLNITFKEDMTFDNFARDFAFYKHITRGQTYHKMGYLDTANALATKELTDTKGEVIALGSETPYFSLYGFTKPKKEDTKGANLGVIVRNAEMTIGGQKTEEPLALYNQLSDNINTVTLTLNKEKVSFKKGDTISLELLLTAWGTIQSETDKNVTEMRQTDAINRLSISVSKGTKVEDPFLPIVALDNGSAEFTITGGKDKVAFLVEGSDSYKAPNILIQKDGKWENYDNSVAGYEKCQVYEKDGKYGFAYILDTDGSAHQFKIE